MPRYPEVFWLFILIVPLLIILIWRYFSGIRTLRMMGGSWRYSALKEIHMVKWFFSSLGFLVFTAASILALAGFPGTEVKQPFKPSGQDIIFVVDISRSMLAPDIQPSRLESAKRIIRSISDGLESEKAPTGNRYGLVVFKGLGSRVFPLSEDREGLDGVLRILSPDIMSAPGTDIAAGLESAQESFVSGSETGRHVILLTDGEDLQGDPGVILNRFRENNIGFTVIGLGTGKGSSIPLADGGTVLNAAGTEVISRLDVPALEQMALQGGGSYLSGEDSRLLETVFSGISPSESGTDYIQIETEQFRLYLIIALAGIVVYQLSGMIRWKEKKE